MKFIFSLMIVLYVIPTEAKEVILINYHPSQLELSKTIEKVMHQNMDFPKEFVEFIESDHPCEKKEVSAAHICLNENGEMRFPIIYTQTMKDTLGVFWKEVVNEIENK